MYNSVFSAILISLDFLQTLFFMHLVGTFEVKWQYCRETADRIEEFIYEKNLSLT